MLLQNEFSVTVPMTLPDLFWIRTWLFSVVIRWFGPTAPWVSGGITVPLSVRARKVADIAGDRAAGFGRLPRAGATAVPITIVSLCGFGIGRRFPRSNAFALRGGADASCLN